MKFHRNNVTPAKPLSFSEDIDFSDFDLSKAYPLLKLSKVHAEGEFYLEENTLCVTLSVHAEALLSDSRTCEPFPFALDYEDDFALLSSMDEEGDGYLFAENVIELRDVVYCSLHSHIPLCPRKSGASLPSSGEGYTVLTEDEVEPLEAPSPFDALKDFPTEE